MALTTGLVACWELEEASGSRADASGNAHTMVESATINSRSAKVANGADFTGGSSPTLTNSDAAFYVTDSSTWTVCFWVLFDTLSTARLLSHQTDFFSDWYIAYSSISGQIGVADDVPNFVNCSTSISSATPYFVCVTHAAGGLTTISINDANAATVTLAMSGSVGASGYIRLNAQQVLDGYIDQLCYWSRVLSGAEITSMYALGSGLSFAGMGGGAGATHHGLSVLGIGGLVVAGPALWRKRRMDAMVADGDHR